MGPTKIFATQPHTGHDPVPAGSKKSKRKIIRTGQEKKKEKKEKEKKRIREIKAGCGLAIRWGALQKHRAQAVRSGQRMCLSTPFLWSQRRRPILRMRPSLSCRIDVVPDRHWSYETGDHSTMSSQEGRHCKELRHGPVCTRRYMPPDMASLASMSGR